MWYQITCLKYCLIYTQPISSLFEFFYKGTPKAYSGGSGRVCQVGLVRKIGAANLKCNAVSN